MATFNLANRIKVVNANPNIDIDYGPYASVADACIAISLTPSSLRSIGKTVGILDAEGSIVEYWWKSNTTDSGLIIKAVETVIDSTPTIASPNAVSSGGVKIELNLKENISNKGIANGYVPLNGSALIDSTYLPSYVDDVIEASNFVAIQALTGESGKIYVALDTNKIYRWATTVYVEVSSGDTSWGTITGSLSNQTDLQNALNAKQNDIIITNNNGLKLTGDTLTSIYNTAISDSVNSVSVGGASATLASIWKTKSIVDVLDTILFPTILASISTSKSGSLSLSTISGDYEIGTAVSGTLTATFNRGQILNGTGISGPNLVGAVTTTPYLFTGTGIGNPPIQSGNTYLLSQNIISGTNSWNVNISHTIGSETYTDNKSNIGTNLDGSRIAGNVSANSFPAVTGYYKQFFGDVATVVTTSANVRALPSNNFTNTNNFQIYIGSTRFVLAIPATKSITSIITQNFENITANFVVSTFNVMDAGNNPISYKVFTFTSGTPLTLNATVILN